MEDIVDLMINVFWIFFFKILKRKIDTSALRTSSFLPPTFVHFGLGLIYPGHFVNIYKYIKSLAVFLIKRKNKYNNHSTPYYLSPFERQYIQYIWYSFISFE